MPEHWTFLEPGEIPGVVDDFERELRDALQKDLSNAMTESLRTWLSSMVFAAYHEGQVLILEQRQILLRHRMNEHM